MRHLLTLLTLLALTSVSYAQVFDVIPRNLGGGYSLAEGSTIAVTSGEVTDWLITVDGRYPFKFTSTGDILNFEDAIITDSPISVELGRTRRPMESLSSVPTKLL